MADLAPIVQEAGPSAYQDINQQVPDRRMGDEDTKNPNPLPIVSPPRAFDRQSRRRRRNSHDESSYGPILSAPSAPKRHRLLKRSTEDKKMSFSKKNLTGVFKDMSVERRAPAHPPVKVVIQMEDQHGVDDRMIAAIDSLLEARL